MQLTRYFSSKEVVVLTGASYRQVDTWVRSKIVGASGIGAAGKGSRRRFNFSDLVEIRLLVSFTSKGVRLGALRQTVETLRNHMREQEPNHVWASKKLVTDGTTIFRFVPNEYVLESLDGCKQLAFAFEMGAEFGSLADAANKLSPQKRYERRNDNFEKQQACG